MHIYLITNQTNNKMYIGQTIQKNPKMRWYAHLSDARRGKKTHLYDSIRKYGVDNFTWEIIDKTDNIEKLNALEEKWLNYYRQITKVYNVREAGGNKLHSEKSKKKMSDSQRKAHAKRKANGTEGGWKRQDGGLMNGKQHSSETKKKISDSHKAYNKKRKEKNIPSHWQVNESPCKNKTWKLIDGKRVWMEK